MPTSTGSSSHGFLASITIHERERERLINTCIKQLENWKWGISTCIFYTVTIINNTQGTNQKSREMANQNCGERERERERER